MAKKEFDLDKELRVTIDNGVKSFDYKVVAIYYNSRIVECTSEDGLNLYTFDFGMVENMGSIYWAEPKANDPPKDEPLNLEDVPF